MNIIVSKNSGYCYGVKKAIETAQEEAKKRGTLYSFGYIIHNQRAVKDLERKGVKVVDEIGKGKDNILFRSHGVEKKYYDFARVNGIDVIDTTCLFVKKIQDTVEKNYKAGKKIIIVGDKDHPEVIGINSRADYTAQFINDVEDLYKIDFAKDVSYVMVFQTTFNSEKYNQIVDKLKGTLPNLTIYNTICNATQKRQESAVDLAKKVDLMIVIGDKMSSNSRKLYELTSGHVKSLFVQDVSDLNGHDFSHVDTVGVTAGASTPDFVIEEVMDYLRQI